MHKLSFKALIIMRQIPLQFGIIVVTKLHAVSINSYRDNIIIHVVSYAIHARYPDHMHDCRSCVPGLGGQSVNIGCWLNL